MTAADVATNIESHTTAPSETTDLNETKQSSSSDMSEMMPMHMEMPHHSGVAADTREQGSKQLHASSVSGTSLNGCLTLATDGKALLNVLQSTKTYRLEAQPLLFSQNANRLVHVSGYFGSVLTVEDPRLPSFVVNTVDSVAPNCSTKILLAQIQKVLTKRVAATRGIVAMSDMGFVPQTLIVNTGERVTWKNSSEVTHNVVADPSKALYRVDVKLPSGVSPFGSGYLQPGQSFSHTFELPGVYHYVCTLHEGSGMKGTIIVKGTDMLRASK